MKRLGSSNSKVIALLTLLEKHRGQVVSYRELCRILGLKSTSDKERHLLRQYMIVIKKILASRTAPHALTVAPGVGYAVCPFARQIRASHQRRG